MTYVAGWLCIGLAAALAAWIWPFRRGFLGVMLNASCSVLGALGAPALAVALGMSPRSPLGLPLAGLGALALLALVHVMWKWTLARPGRPPPRRDDMLPRV